ncbi:MAG TPA: hypothetical protein VK177_17320 [Flavobacteriales bacterium]|nr:hypothetical protein [Flavobacteriales bacterium]
MKRIILASIAVMTLTVANAQQMDTHGGSPSKNGDVKRVDKPMGPSSEARADRSTARWKNELGLNDDQAAKLKTLKVETYSTVQKATEKNPSVDGRDARVAELKPVVATYKDKLKKILTADQYTAWEAQVDKRFESWKKVATAQENGPKPDLEEQRIRMELE